MIKKIINKILNILGFTIQRTKLANRYKANVNEKALYVEFVGVPGVGKSTMFNELNRNRKTNWISISEFLAINKLKKNDNLFDDLTVYQRLSEDKIHAI